MIRSRHHANSVTVRTGYILTYSRCFLPLISSLVGYYAILRIGYTAYLRRLI
nr:MAG TPA: hypothetical protein [Caudoviricetes sp.]